MCIICSTNIEELKYLKTIECNQCDNLTTIPYLPNLRTLDIIECKFLTNISCQLRLKRLRCINCMSLKTIPCFNQLIVLTIRNCPITDIPNIRSLRSIMCIECDFLVLIPKLRHVHRLCLKSCPCIQHIPHIKYLRLIEVELCPKIRSIPNFSILKYIYLNRLNISELNITSPHLRTIVCKNLLFLKNIEIVSYNDLQLTSYYNIPLLIKAPIVANHHIKGSPFINNLDLLLKTQRFIRKWLWYKKIYLFLTDITVIKWYYSPVGPGGKNAIRRLSNRV